METKCHEQPSPHCSQLCLMASPACGHFIVLISDSYRWESLLHISCTNIYFIHVLCWKKKTVIASVLFAKFLDLQAQWKHFRIYSLHRTAIVLLIISVVCVCACLKESFYHSKIYFPYIRIHASLKVAYQNNT